MGVDIVPSLYAFVAYEGNKSLYKSDDVKTYLSGESLGGGLGVKFLNKVETIHALDLRVKALTSVGGVDWKRTTYDASLAWYLRGKKPTVSPRLWRWATVTSIRETKDLTIWETSTVHLV